ncbi:MAG: diguanylate cyclase, partial [Pseudomonadota bacterium]
NAKGDVIGALIKFHDARYSAETTARMAYLAQHDSLTGLLNRYAFEERFNQAAALARRHEKKMVMLFIDLNNFKEVNDTLGHAVGDEILRALGLRLQNCVRTTDHVCRHGGDEFVVLLSDLAEHEQAFAVVDKVRDSATELLRQHGHWASLTLSVGLSVFPNDGETLEALLPHADAAMYRVKAETKREQPRLKP